MKLSEIASAIRTHLKRLEADPVANERQGFMKVLPFWHAGCSASSNRIFITYVSYQGQASLTKAQAEKYLAYLEAGYTGRHWEALKEKP